MVIAHPMSNSDNLSNETLIADQDGNIINSNSLESVPSLMSDGNGARPQSVASIHTTGPNTPTYEELQTKLESSNRNIMHIKEQQQQLLRLQQAAKNQLFEMEQLRSQQQPMSFANNQNAPPDYDNVEDVANDVTSLMSRMKTLTDFIHSQNDLASSLGVEDKADLMEEQTQLQKKLLDLKNKKQQMANLVSELHAMNAQAEGSFEENNRSTATPSRNINDDSFDRIQIDRMTNDKLPPIEQPTHSNASMNDAEEEDDEEVAAAGSVLQDKIAEINAMKDQLKRLQDMMHTVKLIEIKNGDYQPDDEAVPFNEKSEDDTNNIQSNDDPQRDEEEQEMAERVRVLHSMTNDLRQQAVTLAAERDRLKDIKNEMARRRDFDGSEKNLKQQQTHQIHPQPMQMPQPSTSAVQKEQILDSNFLQKKSDVEKSISNESPRVNKESIHQADGSLYSPNNWSNCQNASSTPSLRSSHGGCIQSENPLNKANLGNQGKDSTDSGAADMLNMSIEAASLQSCSSRGYSVPPPMRNISGREASWRKSTQEIPRNNQTNGVYENQTEQNYPWYWHNYNQACSSAAPQSPHCHYHHHMCMPQSQIGANDPMLMQQFIQTQQMLINSVSQCNQLLWDQQREINNLNSAVLLIQERLLNTPNNSMVDANQQNLMRAESVPPNMVCTNQAPFLPRAQSEQPPNFPNFPPASSAMPQSPLPPSPFRQYPNAAQNAQFYRNNQQAVRLLRQPMLNSRNGVAVPYYESDQIQYSNNFLNAHNLSNHTNDNGGPPNNATINNLHQQNLTNASNSATPVTNNSVNATNTVTALNNQVVPGIRANNYYDNFRSYSRQNLLSSASCKSNEIEQSQVHVTHNNLPLTIGNKFRNQINQNTPPDVLNVNQQRHYHDILDNFSSNTNYNNLKISTGSSTNSVPTAVVASLLGTGATAQATASNSVATNAATESNRLSSVANNSNTNNENRCTDDQKSINSCNFDVNELKQPKIPVKTLQKGSTGGSKRVRPLRDMTAPSNERDNQFVLPSQVFGAPAQNAQDLNLASSSNQRSNSKSSSKLFDDLKENVYLEVSALIAANESRPHFLINLFRDLQLISSSDPLRKRLMQGLATNIHEVYPEHCETNESPNILHDMQVSASNIQNDLENPHHQEEEQQHPSEPHFNEREGFNNLAVTTTCVPDLRSSIDEALLRVITVNPVRNESPNSCSYLDLTVKQDCQNGASTSKANASPTPTSMADVFSMEGNVMNSSNSHPSTSQYNPPVCMVSHLSSSINQDLAEADQSMENDVTNNENAANPPEILNVSEHDDLIPGNENSNEGAVGGIESSGLPDLAKVTTTSKCEIDYVDTDL